MLKHARIGERSAFEPYTRHRQWASTLLQISKHNGAVESGASTWLTIGEIARQFDVSLRTLRFYEDRGLLVPRREGTARFYSVRDKARLEQILSLKNLGFTLSEIRDIIAQSEARPASRGPTLRAEQIAAQLAHLERQKTSIEDAIAALRSAQKNVEAA